MLTKIISLASYFFNDFKVFITLYIILLFFFIALGCIFTKVWKKETPIKVITFNLYLFTILLTHLFYGFEIYYRYIFDQTDNVLQIKTTQRWINRHVRINAYSFRNDHFAKDKNPKELRLAAIGDSYTWGYGIKDENMRYSNLIESKLSQDCNSHGSTVKVYNLALPGMGTKEEFSAVTMAHDHQVDGIILGYTLDDPRPNRTPVHTDICYNRIFQYKKRPLLSLLIDNSFAFEYLYVRAFNILFASEFTQSCWSSSHQAFYQDPEIWIRHLNDLKRIIDYTVQNKIGLAVVIFPNINQLRKDYPLSEVHQRLVDFFTHNQIPVVDLLPPFSKYSLDQLMVNPRDFHANKLGHQIAADSLYEQIKVHPQFQCK